MNLLENRRGVGVGAPATTRGAPPSGDHQIVAVLPEPPAGVQRRRLAPGRAAPRLDDQVAAALPIEPEHHRCSACRGQQAALGSALAAHSSISAGAVMWQRVEIEELARPIVAMEPDPPTRRRDREGELGAIAPFAIRRLDLGIVDLEVADPAQRVADNRPLRRQLMLGREVLQLAAAAFVLARSADSAAVDPAGTRLHDSDEVERGRIVHEV